MPLLPSHQTLLSMPARPWGARKKCVLSFEAREISITSAARPEYRNCVTMLVDSIPLCPFHAARCVSVSVSVSVPVSVSVSACSGMPSCTHANMCLWLRVRSTDDLLRPLSCGALQVREGDLIEVMRRDVNNTSDFERWPPKMVRGCRADVYHCSVSLASAKEEALPSSSARQEQGAGTLSSAAAQETVLVFHLAGSGFLYNQIRYMVGALMYVASGVLPLEILRAALTTNVALRLPLAPACGLCLCAQGFAFTSQLPCSNASNPVLFEINRAQARRLHSALADGATCLEDEASACAAKSLYDEQIAPEIAAAWRQVLGGGTQEAAEARESCRRDALLWRWQFAGGGEQRDGGCRLEGVDGWEGNGRSPWVQAWQEALEEGGAELRRSLKACVVEGQVEARLKVGRIKEVPGFHSGDLWLMGASEFKMQ